MAKDVAPTLLIIALAAVITGCTPRSQREVVRISAVSDPASLTLEPGYNDYVRRTRLVGGTEAGIITCRDGSSARYWFRSRHLASEEGILSYFTRDQGSTLFRFSETSSLLAKARYGGRTRVSISAISAMRRCNPTPKICLSPSTLLYSSALPVMQVDVRE
jgi:hypothetical protein